MIYVVHSCPLETLSIPIDYLDGHFAKGFASGSLI